MRQLSGTHDIHKAPHQGFAINFGFSVFPKEMPTRKLARFGDCTAFQLISRRLSIARRFSVHHSLHTGFYNSLMHAQHSTVIDYQTVCGVVNHALGSKQWEHLRLSGESNKYEDSTLASFYTVKLYMKPS